MISRALLRPRPVLALVVYCGSPRRTNSGKLLHRKIVRRLFPWVEGAAERCPVVQCEGALHGTRAAARFCFRFISRKIHTPDVACPAALATHGKNRRTAKNKADCTPVRRKGENYFGGYRGLGTKPSRSHSLTLRACAKD